MPSPEPVRVPETLDGHTIDWWRRQCKVTSSMISLALQNGDLSVEKANIYKRLAEEKFDRGSN